MRRLRAPAHIRTRTVARLLVAIGVVVVLLSMPNWALIAFGLLLALAGWLLLGARTRRKCRRW